MDEQRNSKRHYIALICIVFFSILRFLLTERLPIYVISDSPHDDAWVVSAAQSILKGEWLGDYNHYTLIKGCFAPILLAFSYIIGASYMGMMSAIYILSCLVFVKALSPVVNSVVTKCAIYIVLLFNPITLAWETTQRVYRNGQSQWQLLIVFGSFIALYIRRKSNVKDLIPWAFLGGIGLWSFCNTREDAIWLYPFCFVATVVTIISLLISSEVKSVIKKISVVCMPLVILLIGNMCVSGINYAYYGEFLRNDRTEGYFSEVIKDLYAIAPDEGLVELYTDPKLEYAQYQYNIYYDALNKAFLVSPTFASVRESVDIAITTWDSGETIIDGELIFDHVIFALRDGVSAAGYYDSLTESEAFYKKVHEELQEAFKTGKLKDRGMGVYTNVAPLSKNALPSVFFDIPEFLFYVLEWKDVQAGMCPSQGVEEKILNVSELTGEIPIYETSQWIEFSGWAFADDKYENVRTYICRSDGSIIEEIKFTQTNDIYDYFCSLGYVCENSKLSRYRVRIEDCQYEEPSLMRFVDNTGTVVGEFPFRQYNSFEGDFRFCLDSVLTSSEQTEVELPGIEIFVDRVNKIIGLYAKFHKGAFALGIFGLFFAIVRIIHIKQNKRKLYDGFYELLLATMGIFLSLLLFIIAMSYVHNAAFPAKTYLYLSSAYVMAIAFSSLGIVLLINEVKEWIQKKGIRNEA